MTKSLTEKWKDVELDGGYYYLLMKDETLRIDHTKYKFWNKTICWEHIDEHFVKEVLAPVPSYDEYKRLVSKTEQLEKKLKIATKAFEDIRVHSQRDWDEYDCCLCAIKAKNDIEEVK